jgi:hypothetical protein
LSIDFDKKSLGDFEKTARQGNESKETNNKPRKYARYKTTKAPPRNNPGSARSRVKINNEKIEGG